MKKPTIFGKYLLLERLNVGGMAEVFTAKAFGVEGFERILAIKKILPTMAEDEEFITMFIDDARISVQLNHANVVHIHELGKHDEAYYIAMEYVSGKDLRALLERFRRRREIMPTAMAVFIASKMCEGLDYAHRKKDARGQELHIIHRDVSPQNILLSYEGEVKIIDFGIAKAANRSQKTQAGILKGKFGYMSPEQVRGQPIDRRSDIFAVGVTLYEMLTGEKLFVGESDFSTLEKVRNAEVPLPRQFNPNIPAGLEKVVLKSLAREVEDRYQWSSDLQEDLMRFLLAGDAIYSAKHLSAYMKEAFAEDLYREAEKMERYASISRPEDLEASGITAAPKKKPAGAAPPPPAAPAKKSSGQIATLSANGGAGAVAVGLQNSTNVNIPPPTAEELAEMDGSADRTIIMPSGNAGRGEVDLKTAIGLPSPFQQPDGPKPEAPRQQLRPSSAKLPANAGTSTTHDNLSGGKLSALSGSASDSVDTGSDSVDSGAPPADDTNNDLKPIEMTGFRPALEEEEQPSSGEQPALSNETVPPRGNRPKVVIGDAPVNGATTVGPSPLTGGINETMAPMSTRAFVEAEEQRGQDGEDEPQDEQPQEGEDASQEEAAEEEAPVDQTAERPAVRRRTPPPRQQPQRRQPSKSRQSSKSGKKPGVMIAIGALAVVAILVVGAAVVKLVNGGGSKARLFIVVKPKVLFTATINNQTFDGAKVIELEAGKYTVTLKPANSAYGRQQFPVEVVAGKINQFEVNLVPTEKPEEPKTVDQVADTRPTEPKGTDVKPEPKGPDVKTEPKGPDVKTEPKGTDVKPEPKGPDVKTDPKGTEVVKKDPGTDVKTEPKGTDVKTEPVKTEPKVEPKPWTAIVTATEPDVEISVDGKPRGTTPDVAITDLQPGKTYRGLAKKSGFNIESFTLENKGNTPTVSLKLTMKAEAKKDPVVVVKKDPPPKADPPPKNDPPKASGAKGTLKIASNPTGADVFMDGKATGKKTPVLPKDSFSVPVGKHKFTFKLNGKTSPPVEVNVVEGDNPIIRGELPQ